MPAIGKVTLDAKEYEATLEKLKQKTAAAAQNMSNSAAKSGASANKAISDGAKKVGSDVSAAGGALSAFGAAAGSHLGAAGQAVSALAAGPIAALVGALGALLAVGIAVWDKLTLSSEEYAAKMTKVAERSDKARQTILGRHNDDAGYMARLQELATKESLSNASKAEAANLIKTLTSRYGELGVSIDSVTGSIKGADEAQRQMLARQKQQRISSIRRQFLAHDKKAYTQAQAAVTGMFVGEETLNKIGVGWKSASEAKDNVAEVMETRSLKDRLEMAERLRDASNTQADMNNWQVVIDTIEKQIALQEELNFLRETGDLNAQERADRLKKAAASSQKKEDFLFDEASKNLETSQISGPQTEQTQILRLINELKKQGINLTKEEAELVLRQRRSALSTAYYQEQIRTLTEQIQIQNLINNGLDEAAKKQQILNELKRKGLDYDQNSVDQILELNQKLGATKLQASQKKEAENLYERALRVMGKDKEADERAALAKAKEQKGSDLTADEKAKTLKLVQLTSQLESFGAGGSTADFAIRTNALTARGGFQMENRADDALARHNYAMMNLERSQLRIAEDIKRILSDITGD